MKASKRNKKELELNRSKKPKSKSKKLKIESDEEEEENEINTNIKVLKLSKDKEEEIEEKEPPKVKKTRKAKSVGKNVSKSKSSSPNSKNSSLRKSKKTKIKIKKGKDYIKGKYNLLIEPMKKSKYLKDPSNNIFNECCVNCSNRNCYRAVITKNYELMKNCIASTKYISGILSPLYFNGPNPIEKAIEKNDEKMIEIILTYLIQKKEIRCYPEESQIKKIETGETNKYMFGVMTRKLNTTRGNKMGNDALINDDPNYINDNDNNKYELINSITKALLTKNKNSKLIQFIKTLILNPLSTQEILHFDFENSLHLSLRSGNIEISKYLLKQVQGNFNYGFNALHSDVLNLEDPNEIKIKVKTSLTKKPQTNFGITPMHVACINPDTRFIQKLVDLGGDWNCLDYDNRKPFHYAAC